MVENAENEEKQKGRGKNHFSPNVTPINVTSVNVTMLLRYFFLEFFSIVIIKVIEVIQYTVVPSYL